MSLAGRDNILLMLDRFWDDLAVYAQAPDLSPDALLNLALD